MQLWQTMMSNDELGNTSMQHNLDSYFKKKKNPFHGLQLFLQRILKEFYVFNPYDSVGMKLYLILLSSLLFGEFYIWVLCFVSYFIFYIKLMLHEDSAVCITAYISTRIVLFKSMSKMTRLFYISTIQISFYKETAI